MKKGYQGDEIWSAVNPSGKRELIDPEGEFIPGETIIKLLLQAARWLCDSPWGFPLQSGGGRLLARSLELTPIFFPTATSQDNVAPGAHPGEGGVNPTVALQSG
jgi:hypothetical protein